LQLVGVQRVELVRLGRHGAQQGRDEVDGRLGRQGSDDGLVEAEVAGDVARVHVGRRHDHDLGLGAAGGVSTRHPSAACTIRK